jgi:transcription elongation factor GreB
VADKPAPRPPETNYITPAGFKRLTDEFNFLRSKKRPEVVSALSDAAAEGDRSENAEYIYRKRQLREIDRRLRFLSKRLDDVLIVDPAAQPRRDRVFFGATVTVEDQEGELATYRIVGVDETDGAVGDISWKSPVGRALLGKACGSSPSPRSSTADARPTRRAHSPPRVMKRIPLAVRSRTRCPPRRGAPKTPAASSAVDTRCRSTSRITSPSCTPAAAACPSGATSATTAPRVPGSIPSDWARPGVSV